MGLASRRKNPVWERLESRPRVGDLAVRPRDFRGLAAATLLDAARARLAACEQPGNKQLQQPASKPRAKPSILLFSTKGSVSSRSWAKGAKSRLVIVPANVASNYLVAPLAFMPAIV